MTYAGFSKRAIAMIIDAIILSLISYLIIGVGFKWTGPAWGMQTSSLVLGWIYFSAMESSSRKGTLGKRTMDIQVVNVNGGQLSFGEASIRYFSKILSAFILFIGYFMMFFSDRKQTLHDKIAKTLVINA